MYDFLGTFKRKAAGFANLCRQHAGFDASVQESCLSEITKNLVLMNQALLKLEKATEEASALIDPKDQAIAYRDLVFTAMDELRRPADALEMIVDKDMWPLPSYGDLIFEV